jgi:hypothetical protein
MLLQGLYVVRMANMFLKQFREKKDFVLVALYFHANGEATQFLLYQKDNEVCHKLDYRFLTVLTRTRYTIRKTNTRFLLQKIGLGS